METARDIVIIVLGVTATAFTVIMLALALLLYRKVSAVIDSAQRVIDSAQKTMHGIEAFSRDFLEPLTSASGLLATGWHFLSSLLGLEKREKNATKGSEDGR